MEFRGDYKFLSNAWRTPITIGLDGASYTFTCVESAFQALKAPERIHDFTKLDAKEAKALGRGVDLRKDWDDIREKVMEHLLRIKFMDADLKGKLLAIPTDITYENKHDGFWGTYGGAGDDRLGKLLTKIKNDLVQNKGMQIDRNVNYLCEEFVKAKEKAREEKAKLEEDEDRTDLHPLSGMKSAHCLEVARFMMEKAPFYGLDPSQMYVIGLLHDVGYTSGRFQHEAHGADLLKKMGMKGEYLDAIRYHGTDPYTITIEDRFKPVLALLYDADMSVNAKGQRVGHKERLEDIGSRYGKDHVAYRTAKNEILWVNDYLDTLTLKNDYEVNRKKGITPLYAEDRISRADYKDAEDYKKAVKKRLSVDFLFDDMKDNADCAYYMNSDGVLDDLKTTYPDITDKDLESVLKKVFENGNTKVELNYAHNTKDGYCVCYGVNIPQELIDKQMGVKTEEKKQRRTGKNKGIDITE